MSKKLIHLISFVLVMVLASTTYGNGILIGNFEDQMDGWTLADPNDPNIATSYSTTGVTLGSKSLRIDANDLYRLTIVYSLIDNNMVDEFRKNLKVSADVTRLASEWVLTGEGQWCELFLAVQAGSSGDPNEPNDPNEWDFWDQLDTEADWEPGDGNAPKNFIYDYSTTINEIDFNNLEYLNFIFCTNWGGYDPGGTYYIDDIQIFGGGPAYDPDPFNGEREVSNDTILSWTSGVYAAKHDVYFDTSFNDVNNASRANPLGVLREPNYTLNTYDPGELKYGKTYYWRIDEVNEPSIWKGEVWNFTTAYPGVGVVIGDWEDTLDNWRANQGNPTLSYSTTGATLNDKSLKVVVRDGWFWVIMLPLSAEQRDAIRANDTFSLDVTFVASENMGATWMQCKELAINGPVINWRQMVATGDTSNPASPGDWNPYDFGEVDTRTITWDYSNIDFSVITDFTWCQLYIQVGHDVNPATYYFDNARFIDSRLASNPKPKDRATGVRTEPTLSWKPGKGAVKHDVYFGTDFDKVSDANRANPLGVLVKQNHDANTYDVPGTLAFGTTYYWRIDEVNDPNIRKGPVWRFTTGNYLIVDDFERYTDDPCLAQTWKAGGKATIGLSTAPVHEDFQAMTIDYNNTPSPYYSEAYADTNGPNCLDIGFSTNWLTEGVKALSLWFRGYSDLRGSFSYSGTDPYGPYMAMITADGADIWYTSDQFHYAHRQLSDTGYIQARVDSVENTDAWAKAGLMIRNTLDPDSKYADVVVTPGSGVSFQYREETGGDSTESATEVNVTAPHWVRLTRYWGGSEYYIYAEHANDISGSCANDWTQIGDAMETSLTQGWGFELYFGLCLTSHNAGVMCDANFSNVTLALLPDSIGTITTNWLSQDIGIPYNVPEPMYVMLQDNDSNAAWYYPDTNNPNYADANVTQIGAWTEWRIDLNDFCVQGVDLAKVQRMYIGFGDRAAPGGPGTVHIDDIRLYRPECYRPKLTRRPADYDFDCMVDEKDLDLLTENWLQTPADPNINLYGGGTIDFRDFAEFGKYWYQQQVWPTW